MRRGKNRNLENNYLQKLKGDFDYNKHHLEFAIKTEEILLVNSKLLLKVLTEDSIVSEEELVMATEFAGYNFSLSPRSTTWDDLVSTGNTSLIKHKNLITNIRDYYNKIGWFNANEEMFNQYKLWYRKEAGGVISPYFRIGANNIMGGWMS
jgi:hypothetical protein